MAIQGRQIPLTWETTISDKFISNILTFGPFKDWVDSVNKIENNDPERPELLVEKVHIQGIDMFGPTKLGFVKFDVMAKKWNEKMKQVVNLPGVVFMRGGAVAILCILIDPKDKKEYALLTLQPRIPAGYIDFPEIPAGMLDGEQKFAGKAAQEMREEAMLEIKEHELFDLTLMAYGGKYKGMYPSAGGCDEFLKLFLYRRYMNREALDMLQHVHGGEEDCEVIKLKLVPLDDLWREAPDSKALAALYLYQKFLQLNPEKAPPITQVNEEQEAELLEALRKKDEEKERERRERKKEKDRMEEERHRMQEEMRWLEQGGR